MDDNSSKSDVQKAEEFKLQANEAFKGFLYILDASCYMLDYYRSVPFHCYLSQRNLVTALEAQCPQRLSNC
jgi:hypothetical protein